MMFDIIDFFQSFPLLIVNSLFELLYRFWFVFRFRSFICFCFFAMSSSPPHTPSGISTLPKINLIQVPPSTPEEKPLQRSIKTASPDILPQLDYLKIYNGLTCLFIGDNSICTLYQDVSKVLKHGRLLDYTEASRQNGKYNCIEGNQRERELM